MTVHEAFSYREFDFSIDFWFRTLKMRKETPAVWLAGRMEMLCCGGVALSQEPPFPLWREPWWLWEARQCLVAAWQIYILTIFVLWEPVIGLGQAVHAISIRSCVNKTCSEKLSCRELEWSLSEWRMLTSFNLLSVPQLNFQEEFSQVRELTGMVFTDWRASFPHVGVWQLAASHWCCCNKYQM